MEESRAGWLKDRKSEREADHRQPARAKETPASPKAFAVEVGGTRYAQPDRNTRSLPATAPWAKNISRAGISRSKSRRRIRSGMHRVGGGQIKNVTGSTAGWFFRTPIWQTGHRRTAWQRRHYGPAGHRTRARRSTEPRKPRSRGDPARSGKRP
jgi:hypothetical protein